MRRAEHAAALLGCQAPVVERPAPPPGRAPCRAADAVEVVDDPANRDRLLTQFIDQPSRLVACLSELKTP
jgi:hypothetical protein